MKANTRNREDLAWRYWMTLALVTWALLVSPQASAAVGSWIPLERKLNTSAGQMRLLSDGTVMVQNGSGSNWFQLSPGSSGGYTNGIWTNLAPMAFDRDYYSCDVLPDGRVFIAGGEHPDKGMQSTNAEIYNPLNNRWTQTAYAGGVGFSDSDSVVLSNGTVLVAPVGWNPLPADVTVIYNPGLDRWDPNPPVSIVYQNECSWVKLPDNSILTIDDNATSSERFIPAQTNWVNDQDVRVNLWSNGETGPGLLLPNGKAFFLGGSGHTAIYTPSGTPAPGSWSAGPDIRDGMVSSDAPAAMMPNGKILLAVGSSSLDGGSPAPTWFYEYDYTINSTNAYSPTTSPGNSSIGSSINTTAGSFFFLDLPDGTILVSDMSDPSGQLYVYQPAGAPLATGQPAILNVSNLGGGDYLLTGTLLNGISQGAAFGDDAQMDSNYPIIRFLSGGNSYYGRTFNWSSTGVQTGSQVVSTEFSPPENLPGGPCSMVVIANGIASSPVSFNAPVWVDFNYYSNFGYYFGTYDFPYDTLAAGISGVNSGGTIFINASAQPSASTETMTITKPMTIISESGPSTIGQ